MLADYHTHCSCSADSETPPEAQIQSALAMGLDELCFTDHADTADRAGVPGPYDYDWSEVCLCFDVSENVDFFDVFNNLVRSFRRNLTTVLTINLVSVVFLRIMAGG